MPRPIPPLSPSTQVTTELRGLFDSYYARVWRLLRRLGVPAAQLDDAAQEVFWVAARRLGDINPGSEHAFLYGVAMRTALRFMRRESSAPVCDADPLHQLVDTAPSPQDHVEHVQARRILDEVLRSMPIELRTVFVLHEIEELEITEIAEIESIPTGTVSSRLRRAREMFSAICRRFQSAVRREQGSR